MVRLEDIVLIHDLKRQGLTIAAIARKLGMDRKTVRKHLNLGLSAPCYGPRLPRPSLLAPFQDYLRERVKRFPDLSGKRLLREIQSQGYTGGYTAVTDFLRTVRPSRHQPFECRFETPPGHQAQVDFAHFRVTFTDAPDTARVIWLFTMVLGHSRWIWGRFCETQNLQTLLRCHIDAFDAMGGAPAEVLCDRMKTAVIGEDAEGHVIYNPAWEIITENSNSK